jgi:pimeloyl-[acyl-carrier protein] methyl ester esterase
MAPAHWSPLQDVLSECGSGFAMHCPAIPGHGGVAPSPGWRPEALADRWVDTYPNRVWIGWSLGGLVALTAAQRHPERVRGLILIGATPCFVRGDDWPHGMSRAQFEAFRAQCLADPRGTLIQFTALQMQADRRGLTGLKALRAQAANAEAPDPLGLQHGLDVLETTDLRASLSAIPCRTLWLTGDGDSLTPPEAASWAAARQPRGQARTLEGAGHAPFITDPSTLAGHMLPFIEDLDTP